MRIKKKPGLGSEESKREAKKVEDAYLHIEVPGCDTQKVFENILFT